MIWLLWGAAWEFLLKIKNTQHVIPEVPPENHSLPGTGSPIPAGLCMTQKLANRQMCVGVGGGEWDNKKVVVCLCPAIPHSR